MFDRLKTFVASRGGLSRLYRDTEAEMLPKVIEVATTIIGASILIPVAMDVMAGGSTTNFSATAVIAWTGLKAIVVVAVVIVILKGIL